MELKHYHTISKIVRFSSLRNKIFMVAFVATHIPLFCVIAYLLYSQESISKITILILVLGSTLAGTAFVLWVLHHLLKPVQLCSETLDNYLNNGKLDELPENINDEMGILLKNLSYTLNILDKRQADLKKSTTKDHLTGLLNRLTVSSKLDAMVDQKQQFCIAMIDIDHFKEINDIHGHLAGDAALQQFGKLISNFLQQHSEDAWAARWGGEEFLLVLPFDLETSKQLMNQFRIQIAENNTNYEGIMIKFTASIGLTEFKLQYNIKSNIKTADDALFAAKHAGRNKVMIN